MKKLIKIIICLFIACIHIGAELYPSGKLLMKKYLSNADLEKILENESVVKYMSHLSVDEKDKIISFLKTPN